MGYGAPKVGHLAFFQILYSQLVAIADQHRRSKKTFSYPRRRWRKTLESMQLRYRRRHVAHHPSVSWYLILGKNLLWVAKQHGHRITTMLHTYAAWIEGAFETDVQVIPRSMNENLAVVLPAATVDPGFARQIWQPRQGKVGGEVVVPPSKRERTAKLAGAPGIEPGNGGIKTREKLK